MDIIDKFNESRDQIYEYFGFKEDWVVFPIDDKRGYFWKVIDDVVRFAKTKEQFESAGDYSENEILKHRFYPQSIYVGKDLTMMIVDTHVDGQRYFQIFDNALGNLPVIDSKPLENSAHGFTEGCDVPVYTGGLKGITVKKSDMIPGKFPFHGNFSGPSEEGEQYVTLIQKERADTIDSVLAILMGIDKQETEKSGWWETSVGAKFGAKKLQEIKKLLNR